MSDDMLNRDIEELSNVEQTRERERRVLSELLKRIQEQQGHHFVLQVNMGEVTSYLTSVTLEWVTAKVGYATDLPIFRRPESATSPKQLPQTSETMELVQQRSPDWRRRLEMAAYLAIRRHHKFPPLLLVGYQPWIYSEQNELWGVDQRAMNDSLNLINLEPTGTYWDLDDSGTLFYALDGQHRLMAFNGLSSLINDGRLPALDQRGDPRRGGGLTLDEIVEYISNETKEEADKIHARLQHLMSEERIGIEIIPAVRQGESFTDALRRLRQMFVDVNENAKPLTKPQLAQLDETNGYRIIARKLCQEHELLRSSSTNGETRVKVDLTLTQLPDNSDCYTSLHTLAEVVKRYLKENKKLSQSASFASWDNLIAKGVRVRPADSVIDEGKQEMLKYFNLLERIPSHTAFIQGKPAGQIRKSSVDGSTDGDNILFRPIVQSALSEALGKLAARDVLLENAVEKLSQQERRGQLMLTSRRAPWFGVLCNVNGRMRRDKQSENLCCRLFCYLLGGGHEDDQERNSLKCDFAKARQIDPENKKAINMEGKVVDTDRVQLPHPWQ